MQMHAQLSGLKPPRRSSFAKWCMNDCLARLCIAGSFALLIICPSSAQKGSPSPPPPPTAGNSAPPVPHSSQPSKSPSPYFLYGRVVLEGGQPVSEPVSVALTCGIRVVQMIHTDLKGNFQFVLGAGPQSNVDVDFSADNQTSSMSPADHGDLQQGRSGVGDFGDRLSGCDVEVSVPGYQPLSKTLTDTNALEGIDTGTLVLTRIAGMPGSAISVTSLQAPNNARKEFDKGEEEARSGHLESATKHLEKAVAEYGRYAAAWNELGKVNLANHQTENARHAFTNAITADPQYIPPYVSLASLELQAGQYESAARTAGTALELQPGIVFASFIQAVANLGLNRLDAAEKSARDAENGLHQNIPQVHLLLAEIFVRKRDYASAAEQMRAYLKESPEGKLAAETKLRLEQIEKSAATVGGTAVRSTESPETPSQSDR